MSREYCYRCYRPRSACLCGKIKLVRNKPGIIILQHKDEVRHPKGSAIIADLSLQNCVRYVGEDFSAHPELNQLLQTNLSRVFLVFPAEQAMPLSLLNQQYPVEDALLEQYVFIFIDASWRKASKIWHLSTNLHQLKTIKLDHQKVSNYRIRKAPAPGLLSTVESIVALLSSVESATEKYQPLLDVFNAMIDHQIKRMGDSVYQKNHPAY